MKFRHTSQRLAALAGATVLATGLLAGTAITESHPAAAQGPLQAPDLTVALAVSPATVEPQAAISTAATIRFRNGPIGLAPTYAGGPVDFEIQLPAGSTIQTVT